MTESASGDNGQNSSTPIVSAAPKLSGGPRGKKPRSSGAALVIDWIYTQIQSGQVPVGARLPSIAEIAAACGVGVKTARSAVEQLAGRGVVRTRQGSGTVVITAPREISDAYVATSSGRRLVGALVPNLTNYGEILAAVESVLSERDGRLMLTCSHYEHARECDEIESLLSDGAEGILCSASVSRWTDGDDSFERLRNLRVPCVLMERRLPGHMYPRIPAVLTDLEQAAFLATDHLIRLGRSRVAGLFLAGNPGEDELRRGYLSALAAAGHPTDPALILARPKAAGAGAADLLIESGADAVFVAGGPLATELVGELLRRRLRVPRDIAVAAYDAQSGDSADIPLTSVTPQRTAIGLLAARMLMDQLAHPRSAAVGEFRIHPTLIVRRSTIGPA